MPTLNELIIFKCQNEYVLEHDLPMTNNFPSSKIYNANGDLNKRWYVYFSFWNPKTGKLERMKNSYGKSNNYRTKEDCLSVLTIYRKKLLVLLKAGFNPFEDNIVILQQRINKADVLKEISEKPHIILLLNFLFLP